MTLPRSRAFFRSRLHSRFAPACALLVLLSLLQAPDAPRRQASIARAADELPSAPRLLATDQRWGYHGNVAVIQDGNRDDGDLILGRLPDFDYLPTDAPKNQFENVATDRNTGLMWLRDVSLLDGTNEQGARGNVRLDRSWPWGIALQACETLIYAGHDDWRLPSIQEMSTVVDLTEGKPSYNKAVFLTPYERLPGAEGSIEPGYFWTSTTYPRSTTEAFFVNFVNGHTWPYSKEILFGARCVRDDASVSDPVALLQTGQRRSYAPGDDGAYRKGLAHDYEYRDDGLIDSAAENLLVDRNTGLMWLRDLTLVTGAAPGPESVTGSHDFTRPLDWQSAVDAANALEYGGYDDWRMPNLRELESIIQPGRPGGPLDDAAFPNPPEGDPVKSEPANIVWWSSTSSVFDWGPLQLGKDAAWYIDVLSGSRNFFRGSMAEPKFSPQWTRPVRDVSPSAKPEDYRLEVRGSADFIEMAIDTPAAEVRREGKFILRADAASGLRGASASLSLPVAAAFQKVSRYPLHYEFLKAEFPETFAGLSPEAYTAAASLRESRAFLAGVLREFETAEGVRTYGYDLYVDDAPEEALSMSEVERLHALLAASFHRRPLAYSPTRPADIERARAWAALPPEDAPTFPIAFPSIPKPPDYEPYTSGEAVGYLRRLRLAGLSDAVEAGTIGPRDIVVLDGAPTDLETVVSGIVTGARQGALSHLNIRASRRGTPNAFLVDAFDRLEAYEGTLVRLTLGPRDHYLEADIAIEEAEAFWAERRPEPVTVSAVESGYADLPSLREVGEADVIDLSAGWAISRVGGKAAGLGRLYTFLEPRYQVPGFAIPFRHYLEFMAANETWDEAQSPPVRRSLSGYLEALHADPRFRADGAYRLARLEALRDEMRDESMTAVPEELVSGLAARIGAVFGPNTMVRFRSSSNAEDDLRFNGAGLYDSTSVCAADSLDDDDLGPSRCNPDEPDERTIERGLRKVWASLWNGRAWDERDWYGIEQLDVAMAVLVTPAFPDERANGVAFTGDPTTGERGAYLINVQQGDASVVLPDPGVVPERVRLRVDGDTVAIERLQPSSLVPEGEVVMRDAELRELGLALKRIDDAMPLNLQGVDRESVMLDLEFKLRREDDGLVFKQVRPFLAAGDESGARAPELRLVVPETLELCSVWSDNRWFSIDRQYRDQWRLRLEAGDLRWPARPVDPEGAPTQGFYQDLRYGPGATVVPPLEMGRVETSRAGTSEYLTALVKRPYYNEATRRFATIELRIHDYRDAGIDLRIVDKASLQGPMILAARETARENQDGVTDFQQRLVPCGLPALPLYAHELVFENGERATLYQRLERDDGGTGLSALVRAEARVLGQDVVATDLSGLVYHAERHHWNEVFRSFFPERTGGADGITVYRDFTGDAEPRYRAELFQFTDAPPGWSPVRRLRGLKILSVRRYRVEGDRLPGSGDGSPSATPRPSATPGSTSVPPRGAGTVYLPFVRGSE